RDWSSDVCSSDLVRIHDVHLDLSFGNLEKILSRFTFINNGLVFSDGNKSGLVVFQQRYRYHSDDVSAKVGKYISARPDASADFCQKRPFRYCRYVFSYTIAHAPPAHAASALWSVSSSVS